MATIDEQFKSGGYLQPEKANVTGGKEFFDALDSLVTTKKDNEKIVAAGMPFIEKALYENTPELNHNMAKWADKLYGKERRFKHIRDGITWKPGDTITGGTRIGFVGESAPVARWVNWGTYRQEPQFFMEKTFKEKIPFDLVFQAQKEAAMLIQKQKLKGIIK